MSAAVPARVLSRLTGALATLREQAVEIDRLCALESRIGGAGRYQADAHINRADALAAAQHVVAEFRRHAPAHDVDAEAVIATLGGVADVTPSAEAQAWLAREAT